MPPPLLTAAEPSIVRIAGGTHNRGSPPFDFVQRALGRGGSFTTRAATEHLRSNALIIERFMSKRIAIGKSVDGFEVRVG